MGAEREPCDDSMTCTLGALGNDVSVNAAAGGGGGGSDLSLIHI